MGPSVPDQTILIIDDEPVLRLALKEQLQRLKYRCEECPDLASAGVRLSGPAPALVLLDLQLPDGSGLTLLPRLSEKWPTTKVVMMTAHASIKSAVEAMENGAFSYLQKPLDESEFEIVVRRAIETGRLESQADDRRQRAERKFGIDSIIGKSASMSRLLQQIRTVAASPASTVLLLGESGVGKGHVARALHYASLRAQHPFLTVTCSAIPENLLEAELFGHERGAFTDAKTMRRGVFEAADGGTVFLDEIGDMPPTLQSKLLGVLEERTFHRVGSTETQNVDVRIIAATHRDLPSEVAAGRFREDLYYRLRVVPIVIPPLRERVADILELAQTFVARFNSEFARSVENFDEGARAKLRDHTWPGNVRELRNVLEHAQGVGSPGAAAQSDGPFELPSDGLNLEQVEDSLVRQALARSGGNKSRAARLLGISRDQIRYRIEKMNTPKP